ncbi:Hypothetical protein DEACI_2915 [Acididesulfobacillus acetoxydans]|uniref:Uncharacterized protein n=1 Tax=Acididesulfobacillus acetoxydans TaxID=1561005 RepID=A0A8S0WGV9_9FIRM|nr:Hypothetical protein DEACI_2915 [Acididesulfobacillus acetoxydans]CEJ07540.1 Hypothetical protein DEACI_2006 [Acididesulfobacillus acetoxydans]
MRNLREQGEEFMGARRGIYGSKERISYKLNEQVLFMRVDRWCRGYYTRSIDVSLLRQARVAKTRAF